MILKILGTFVVVILGIYAIRKHRKLTWGECKSKRSMKNKIVIITGANSGIGKATALELAKRGAHVILACRDLLKAQQALNEIRARTSNGTVEIMHLDLSSFQSIKSFSKNFLMSERRLDVLINNAGIFQCPFTKTTDGFEMQFGVNHLGHFLLTKLLLERLKDSAPSRIIIVSSELYKKGKIDFSTMNSAQHYNKSDAYKSSKMANVLFGRELARRMKGTGVSVYIVSPGMVYTNLHRHISINWLKRLLLLPIACIFVRTPYQGCQTILHCAISEDVENESGYYYRDCKQQPFEGDAESNLLAERLCRISDSFIQDTISEENMFLLHA